MSSDDELLEHSVKDRVKATNQGISDYVLIPRDISKKFKISQYPIEFDLTAGINDDGHLVLKFVRKNDKGNYDHLR